MSYQATLQDLRAKVRQLEKQKQELDRQVEALHISIRIFEQSAGIREELVVRDTFKATLTNTAEDFLKLEGRAMHRTEILSNIQERGIHVGGKDPLATLGSYLSRDDRFKAVGNGNWILTSQLFSKDEVLVYKAIDGVEKTATGNLAFPFSPT